MHEVIDRFFEEIDERGIDLREIEEKTIKEIIDKIISEKQSQLDAWAEDSGVE